MNTKLEQYKIFCVAADAGSFSEAAKCLFITQSAVSQQIRSLEDELGIALFVRGRKGAKLTSHGELLYSYAKRSLDEIENAESLFERMKTLDEGNLRIGAGDTLTRHFLISFLEKFHSTYPNIKIEIVNRVTGETLKRLSAGKTDVAFVNLPIENDHYQDISIREIETLHEVFIAGSKYSYLKDKTLSMKDIASLPLVMLEPKSNTRRITNDYFNSYGIQLKPEFELGSHDLLFDFASKNLGIACVTEEFSSDLEKMNVFKLKTDFEMPTRSIGICTHKNIPPTPAVAKLIEMIETAK